MVCYHAWNIVINNYLLALKCLARAFQYINNLFLTQKELFQNLQLCFIFELYIQVPEARFALYFLNKNHVLVEKLKTLFIHYFGREEQLTKFIKPKALNGPKSLDLRNICLNVYIIFYNVTDCKNAVSNLINHLQSNMLGSHLMYIYQTNLYLSCAKKLFQNVVLLSNFYQYPPGFIRNSERQISQPYLFQQKKPITLDSVAPYPLAIHQANYKHFFQN